jgi:hypothetical protein
VANKSKAVTVEVKGLLESGFISMDDMWPKNQQSFDVQTHGRPSRIFQLVGRGMKHQTITGGEDFPYFHWKEGSFDCVLEVSTWNGGTPFEEYLIRLKGGAALFVELGSSFKSEWEYWWPKKFENFDDAINQFNEIIVTIVKSNGLAYSGFPRNWFLKSGKGDKVVQGLQ